MNPALSQWMTPAWAARELVEAHFSDLELTDHILEPTCGDGRWIQALPDFVTVTAVDIDPLMTAKAHARTGREIITADIFDVEIPKSITAVVGNPPFEADFVDKLLTHIGEIVGDGCRAGFILPAYFMQSPSRVIRWNKRWTMSAELLPRTIFTRSQLPLIFSLFTKDPLPKMNGMRLYYEAQAVTEMRQVFREEMVTGSGKWRTVVRMALESLGHRASLSDIYDCVSTKRPTPNEHWREKIRQTLQRGNEFVPHGSGVWELKRAA
jgi:adenine-specific DNA-methyltransferase